MTSCDQKEIKGIGSENQKINEKSDVSIKKVIKVMEKTEGGLKRHERHKISCSSFKLLLK